VVENRVNATDTINPIVLDWDSRHFGFAVAKANWSGEGSDLQRLINWAVDKQVTLLYLFAPTSVVLPTWTTQRCVGVFVSERVEFEKAVGSNRDADFGAEVAIMELTAENCQLDSVTRLGVLAGRFSRFSRDPRIPQGKAQKLFEIWAEKSVRRELADTVFGAFRADGDLIGFVTLKQDGLIGRIGLLTVVPERRSMGCGRALVCATETWAAARKLTTLRVVTQADNEAACGFYRRVGFHECERQVVFHLWLREPSNGTRH